MDLLMLSAACQAQTLAEEEQILACNAETGKMGLSLTQKEVAALLETRAASLLHTGRVEFGGGITEKLIRVFCDSPYVTQQNYVQTLHALTELFYQLKNETDDRVSDDALLAEMRRAFDGECGGSLDLLSGDAMPVFVRKLNEKAEDADD